MFEFVFKMFSEGKTAIPAKGMAMIPKQLAECLSAGDLLLNENVLAVEGNEIKTASGNAYSANNILLTADVPAISKRADQVNKEPKSVVSLYFSADKPPFTNRLSH